MEQQTSKEFSKLIGIPYNKMDCWQVAKEFYKLVFEIELKHYYQETPTNRDLKSNLIYSNKGDFIEVESPQFGDLITIKLYGVECHIAVFLGSGKMLHTSGNTGCIIDSLKKWEKLITGYYRVKND
jgi:cell wall-associated NlpC family hydrolase